MLKIAVFVLCFCGPSGWLLAGLLVLGSLLRDQRRRRNTEPQRTAGRIEIIIHNEGPGARSPWPAEQQAGTP